LLSSFLVMLVLLVVLGQTIFLHLPALAQSFLLIHASSP
jgi:hypothetical protein